MHTKSWMVLGAVAALALGPALMPVVESAQNLFSGVVIVPRPFVTALRPGSTVDVYLVDNLGNRVTFPSANVGVAWFEAANLAQLDASAPDPRQNLDVATWFTGVAASDLGTSAGKATFVFPLIPGLDMTPGFLWAYYEATGVGAVSYDAWYAEGKQTMGFYGIPGQGPLTKAMTPVFGNAETDDAVGRFCSPLCPS